ncbi:MAG: LptF/LptG family permease [Rhodospirillaceae bacterium]
MSGITWYIFRQLGLGTVMVGLVLTLIVWLTQSLQFLQFIINKGLALGDWLKLTTLLLPSFVGVILPTALFFVVVFIYNKLIVDRELVVVQAAGVSRWGLASPALAAAAAAVVVGYALSLFGVPAAYRGFREAQWNLKANASQVLIREGAFNTLTDGLTVYVRERGRSGELEGVIVHDSRQPQKSITLMAEHGALGEGDNGPRIVLANGSRQELPRGSGNLSLLYFDSYALDLDEVAAAPEGRYANNQERSTLDLLSTRESETLPPQKVSRMHAEAHQRLVGPLAALGYTLVALIFMLTGVSDKRGQIERIAGAVGVIVLLHAAALGAMNLAARALFFVPLMYVVGLVPVAAGLYIIAAPDRSPLSWLAAFPGVRQAGRLKDGGPPAHVRDGGPPARHSKA